MLLPILSIFACYPLGLNMRIGRLVHDFWLVNDGSSFLEWKDFHMKLRSGTRTFLEIFSGRRRRVLLRYLGFRGLLKGGPSDFLVNLEHELCLEYQQILKQDEHFLFQKSSAKWLFKGERNT